LKWFDDVAVHAGRERIQMKITCHREKLLSAFQTAATVAPSRSPKPILRNVRLEVGDRCMLTATDMEVGIRIEVEGIEVQTGGAAVLPVDRFGSLLRESTDEQLQIETLESGAVVKGERSEFNLPAENPDEFPVVAEFTETKYHTATSRFFKELIRRTLFATDTESSRYALGGVLLEMNKDSIVAVGTDGRRLAKMGGPAESIEGHESGEQMVIVPTRSMQLIERALADDDSEVQICARSNDILVRSARTTIYTRLVEGRFPKWRDVLPEQTGQVSFQMTVGPLHSAIRQAAVVASDESRGIDFRFGTGTLVLSGRTAEVGQSRVELPIPYDGEEVIVTLDHRYVTDFLKVLEPSATFNLSVDGSEAPALFSTEDNYGYVIMPLARDP